MKLQRLRKGLAALTDEDLRDLRRAAEAADIDPKSLFVWLRHVVTWEEDRRSGQISVLRLAQQTLDVEEILEAVEVLHQFAAMFQMRGSEVAEVMAAMSELVRGDEPLH